MNYRLAQVIWVIGAVIFGYLSLSQLPDAVSSQSPAFSLMGLIDAAGAVGCIMMALCSKSFHTQKQNANCSQNEIENK